MDDKSSTPKDRGDYFSPEAIAARRAEEPPDIAAKWQAAAAKLHQINHKHWDGKYRKK